MPTKPNTGKASKPWTSKRHPRTRAKTTAPWLRAGGAVCRKTPPEPARANHTWRRPAHRKRRQVRRIVGLSGQPRLPPFGRSHLRCAGLLPGPSPASGRGNGAGGEGPRFPERLAGGPRLGAASRELRREDIAKQAPHAEWPTGVRQVDAARSANAPRLYLPADSTHAANGEAQWTSPSSECC
jgi:hypothetical protein